jgi:hypothetical protein
MVYMMIKEQDMSDLYDQKEYWNPDPRAYEDFCPEQLCLDLWDQEVSEEYERWLDDLEAANPPWSDR